MNESFQCGTRDGMSIGLETASSIETAAEGTEKSNSTLGLYHPQLTIQRRSNRASHQSLSGLSSSASTH